MLLSLENVSKSYGASLVISDITAKIEDNERIGLIGINGAGKSTLLNIICGELEHDTGSIARSFYNYGFLRQNSGLDNDSTIINEMRSVFSDLYEMQDEMRKLEESISKSSTTCANYTKFTERYAYLTTTFEAREGYLIDVKISTILNGMGFLGADPNTLICVLSGGEKTRLALCKLLLESPSLLILDEPTNHLDFKTLIWLEDYLQNYKGALLIVSHDRYFLDQLCTSIWAIENHSMQIFTGNYSKYVLQKGERDERLHKEYDMQQVEIATMKDFIARNIVRASTTARAQSRQKALDNMEIVKKPKPPARPAKIKFEYTKEPVKDVLIVENLSLAVGEEPDIKNLCNNIDFTMRRGEKIALIGFNGVGKSTFLKALQGIMPHKEGEIYWGKNTDISYFEQEEFGFSANKSALDELWDRFPKEYEHSIRTVLGNVGLIGENVYKQVSDLSGGERAKLKFAILILSCGNVLIMDEPTNHLDAATKESLDSALCSYTGTLLVVSHDRYLLNKFPDKIAEMHSDRIVLYNGNYDFYLKQKNAESSTTQIKVPALTEVEKSPNNYRTKKDRSEDAARKKRIVELELLIEELEGEVSELEKETSSPEIAKDYILLQQKCDLLLNKKLEITDYMNEWARLSENV